MSITAPKVTPDEDLQSRAIKVSLPIPPSVYGGLVREAKAMQREVTEHIQRILAEHVIDKELIEATEARNFKLLWRLVQRCVDEAQRICREGGFTSAITLNAIQAAKQDPQWIADYREFVQDDIYKNGNFRKGIVNREIGFRIRAAIGGVTRIGANGKTDVAKVLGEIIQSYTPMVSFDEEAVKIRPHLP